MFCTGTGTWGLGVWPSLVFLSLFWKLCWTQSTYSCPLPGVKSCFICLFPFPAAMDFHHFLQAILFYLSPAAECFCFLAEIGEMDLGNISLVFHWWLSFSFLSCGGVSTSALRLWVLLTSTEKSGFFSRGSGAMQSFSSHCCFLPPASPKGGTFLKALPRQPQEPQVGVLGGKVYTRV